MSVNLSFLWHMHQPDYRDKKGFLQMPWVFLHSIKDYYEMPWLLSLFPNLKATFNLTPSLIKQIQVYEKNGYKKDKFLLSWIKDPKELEEADKKSLIKICKSSQFDTMVSSFPRFAELFYKDSYNDNELIELEVLFMLSWCGNFLRQNDSVIKNLIDKKRGYNALDKANLLDTLLKFIPKILPFYAKLLKKGQISLSTTPFNHPILPLLLDMNNAKISNPDTALPKEYFSLEDDALKQVDFSIKLYKEVFGVNPNGFWPAEGAVDEKSLQLYKRKGIKWVATDEAILFKTLKNNQKDLIYELFEYSDVFIAFRDHFLSDLIGFSYRYQKANDAVNDFVHKVNNINSKKEDATVFVIVDGENAWEFYQNNAMDFFIKLYEKLSNEKNIQTRNFDEINNLKKNKLATLHPGSWIYGTFDTWVGHNEKNRAWELIYQTKRDTKECIFDEKTSKLVEKHFLASECSDWFWWYGDDHFSDFLEEFDLLFRSHLQDIYKLANMKIPSNLMLPISKEREAKLSQTKPQFNITVNVNGIKDSFYEWLGSGLVDESKAYSTMDTSRGIVQQLYYGEDANFIYIRLDADNKKLFKEYEEIKIHLKELKKIITLPIMEKYEQNGVKLAIKDILELSIDKKICKNMKKINLQIEITDKKSNSQFVPIFGDIEVCNEEFEKNWFL